MRNRRNHAGVRPLRPTAASIVVAGLVAAIALWHPAGPASAAIPRQDSPADQSDPSSLPTVEALTARIESLTARGTEESSGEIRVLRQALGLLREIEEVEDQVASIAREIEAAPDLVIAEKAELAKIQDRPPDIAGDLASASNASMQILFARFDAAKAQLDIARREVAEAREAEVRRGQQGREFASRLERIRSRQSAAAAAARLAITADPTVAKASTVLALVQEARETAERELLAMRPRRHIATAELNAIRRQIAVEQSRMAAEALRKWSDLLAETMITRAEEVRGDIERIRNSEVGSNPLVRATADRNLELVDTGLRLLEEARASILITPSRLERAASIDRLLLFEDQRLALGGSRTIVPQLRQELAGLGQIDLLSADLGQVRKRMLEDYLLEIELSDEITRLQDPRGRAASVLADSGEALEDPGPVIDALAELYNMRRGVMVGPLMSQIRQGLSLYDQEAIATASLLDSLTRYRQFVIQHLLAIRTGPVIGPAAFSSLDRWSAVLPTGMLSEIGPAVAATTANRPWLWVFGVGGVLILIGIGPRCRRIIRRTGDQVRRVATDRFALTLLASILTAFLAAPIPLALWTLSTLLKDQSTPDALMVFASVFWVLVLPASAVSLVASAAISGGLAEAHFNWSPAMTRRLRVAARWLLLGVLPIYALSIATLVGYGVRTTSLDEVLGRLGFVVACVLTSVLVLWTLRPAGLVTALRSRGTDRRPGRPDRGKARVLLVVLSVLAVATPIFAAILSWFGFSFATLEVLILYFRSLWLVALALLLRDLLERSLASNSRRIAFEQAKKRRAEARAKSGAAAEHDGEGADAIEEPTVDLESVNEQAYRIVSGAYLLVVVIGLATIWSKLVPAFGWIEEMVLWNTTREIPGIEGAAIAELVPVSLFDLISAVLVVVLTVMLTRNIPGILQLLVLPRLPLSEGVGYAVVSFTRYGIGVVGILVAVSLVGLRWNQVQWLASAAVLGLSFGLQEIFSNFVSGVLMLVEQPVRVGDVVTVNGVTGRVSRIQIRATTITDWDRHELVIPNKAFITGQFSNWTLSDTRTRQVIRVGVAYGSDLRLVEQTLIEVASQDPDIATDPAPSVVLQQFGESSVDFDLRVVLSDVATLPMPSHRIRMAVAERFEELGIKIPFPQRDLHLRSIDDEASSRLRPST